MKIKEFLNSHQTATERARAKKEFASSVGVSESTVRAWVNGTRHPHRSMWKKIEIATKRKIKAVDLI